MAVDFSSCHNNRGSFCFMMEAYTLDPFKAERGFQRMINNGIEGTDFYLLWSDCCGRDTAKAVDIMVNEELGKIVQHLNRDGARGIPF